MTDHGDTLPDDPEEGDSVSSLPDLFALPEDTPGLHTETHYKTFTEDVELYDGQTVENKWIGRVHFRSMSTMDMLSAYATKAFE